LSNFLLAVLKEEFDRVMRLVFEAASILRYDLELGEYAIGKTLKELADWATNGLSSEGAWRLRHHYYRDKESGILLCNGTLLSWSWRRARTS
jgi:hypothetical protein